MQNIKGLDAKPTAIIIVVLLCALILRLYNINQYDLWFDELGSDSYSSENLSAAADLAKVPLFSLMFTKMKNDPHSSFYYFLVYLYSKFFGDGPSLRILSVIFSMLSLGVFYKLSRLFFNRQVSMYALLLMALNPLHLWYAQEARVYAMACFFSLLMIYHFMQALKTNKRVYWIGFSIASSLAIYSSYHSGFLLIASAVIVLFRNNRKIVPQWFLSVFISLIFLLFMFPIFAGQASFVKTSFWLHAPTNIVFLFTWMIFNLGYTATLTQLQMGLVLFLFLFLCGVGTYYETNKRNTIILLLFLFLPIILIYFYSRWFMPVYLNRQLLIFSPFYYLFIARGIYSINNIWAKVFVIICVFVLMSTSISNYYRGYVLSGGNRAPVIGAVPKKNYHDVVKFLANNFQEGDLIAATDIQSFEIIRSTINDHGHSDQLDTSKILRLIFYPRELHPFTKRFLKIDTLLDNIPHDDNNKMHSYVSQSHKNVSMHKISLKESPFNKIWLFTSTWVKDGPLDDNTFAVKDYMRREFSRDLTKANNGFYLERYVHRDFKQ